MTEVIVIVDVTELDNAATSPSSAFEISQASKGGSIGGDGNGELQESRPQAKIQPRPLEDGKIIRP